MHARGQNKKCAIIFFEPITFLMEDEKMDEIISLSPEFARLLNILDGDRSGNTAAQYEFAVLLLKTGTLENTKKAVVQFRDLAHGEYTTSQTNAQFMLGLCYENGFGVSKSYQSAIRWYRNAVNNIYHNDLCKNPDPVSERGAKRLAELTEGRDFDEALDEILFDKTSDESIDCVKDSAEAGDMESQEYLMELYDLGTRDVLEDKEEAMYWAQKAAENGSTKAMEYVADQYYFGRDVEKNVSLGLHWYEMASQNGSDTAPGAIARHLEAQKRYKEAAAWYRIFAERQIKYRNWRLGWEGTQNAGRTDMEAQKYSAKQLNLKGAYNGNRYMNDIFYYDAKRVILASGMPEGGVLIAFPTRRGNKRLSAEGLSYFVNHFCRQWVIGRFFHGMRYHNGSSVFDDNSLCANILADSTEDALQTAVKICRRFNQNGALLKMCNMNALYVICRQDEKPEPAHGEKI